MRRGTLAIGIALAVACAGCGPAPAGRARSLTAFGACDAQEVDGAPADSFVSSPGVWLRVRAIEDGNDERVYGGTYEVVGGDAEDVRDLGAPVTALTISGGIANEIRAALGVTPDVYVHTGGVFDVRQVDFALALTADDFAFLGHCQRRLLTEPLRSIFGDGAVERVRGLVGKKGADVAAAFPTTSPPPSVTILNPETAPKELLASLAVGRFALARVPDNWTGAYTICTRIPQGWSDCVDLGKATTSPVDADMYYDPARPVVEVWLADANANLAAPLARLATVDLAALARDAGVPLAEPRVVGTLSLTTSVRAASRDPALAAGSFDRIALG